MARYSDVSCFLYITKKDKQQKWMMGTVGMAVFAAVQSGIMALILK